MLPQKTSLTNFLEIPYDVLQERNLAIKKERGQHKSAEYFRKKFHEILQAEKEIKAVTVCFSNLEGRLHMLDYNKDFILESDENLTFDGSSIRGFAVQCESDLRLVIDWSSFRFIPADIFGAGKVLVFANVRDQDGQPYASDFRSQLQVFAEEIFKKDQLIANISPEIEGLLLDGTDAEQLFDEKIGVTLATEGGYYNALPQDKLRLFIDKVAEVKRALGFENEKDHPEVAPAQFELNYKYTDALPAADQIQLYKLVCRQVAKTMGCTATFLPKPKMNVNGNGMHTNISLSKNGQNIFHDAQGKNTISAIGWDFLTHILYHAKELCLILCPSVNAYRRLDPHFEAPNEIKVSANDRGAMIRIPLGNAKSARIEVRSAAPDCNPYLEILILVKTGLAGINASDKEKKEIRTVLDKREKLPGNIYDAIRYFKKSSFITNLIGGDNQKKFSDLKEMAANRCPKELGTLVKAGEVHFHHEVYNQYIWSKF
jgi:glutamine synthetase